MQDQDRGEIRHSIGRNLGICIVGEATSTVDKASLIDAVNLRGGDDEHNEKQVMIFDPAGSIVAGEKQFVSDYDGTNSDATTAEFSANIADGDKFEMWDTPWFIDDINDLINQAIQEITKDCPQVKKTDSQWTKSNHYEYDWLSDFLGLHKVEHVSDVGIDHLLSDCETAWTAGANVVATRDSTFERMGTYCAKLVVAAGAAAGAVLGYIDISSLDISDCDRVEFDMYSSIALTAGYLDFVLDNHAGCVSPIESIDIPAMTAAKWYRHSLSLANPHTDTAIISLGLVNTTDVGACTIYIDNVRAVKNGSKIWKELNPNYWEIVRDSTNYLKFTSTGLSVVGTPTQIRLNGLQDPALFSDDTTDSEIDPQWIIDWCTGRLLISHAKSSRLSIDDKADKAKYYLGLAEQTKSRIRTAIPNNYRQI